MTTSLANVEVHQLFHILRRGRLDGRVHWLREDGLVVRVHLHVRVLETTDTGHRSEVVVEGTVFLHEEHDMLDVLQRVRSPNASQRDGDGHCAEKALETNHRDEDGSARVDGEAVSF